MGYKTILGTEVQVTSRDIRLTRGQTLREHTVVGYGLSARVLEDRMSGLCEVYFGGRMIGTTASLSQAYRTLAASGGTFATGQA